MKSYKFGQSVLGQPIVAHQFGEGHSHVLILGGVHGDEWEGVFGAKSLLNKCIENFTFNLKLTIVPEFNPDGVLKNQRKNANAVDLNRNLPTKDWTSEVAQDKYHPGSHASSEPENQALVHWVGENTPQLIISLHSWKPMLNVNGECNPEAQILSDHTGYKIHPSIGYPTPGCLGTYAGLEMGIPTITYELERNMNAQDISNKHVPALLKAIKSSEERKSK